MPSPNPDGMWSEVCLIAIAADGGSDVQFGGKVVSHNINFGAKDFESIPTSDGSRLVKFMPQEDAEVEFEAYALQPNTASGTTGNGFFDLMHANDTSQPVAIDFDRTRTKFRVCFLWTNDTTITTAQAAVTASATISAFRVVLADGYFTEISQDWSPSDGLKFTLKYKTPAFDDDGGTNIRIGGAITAANVLPALASYVSDVQTTKFHS